MILIVVFLCLAGATADKKEEAPIDDGIEWKSHTETFELAKKEDKPIMFFMTKSWCKPCKKLTESFAKTDEFKELSKKFVMAKAIDDAIPKDEKFNFDGKYIPKILFFDSAGNCLKKVINQDAKEGSKSKHFYKVASSVVKSMQETLKAGSIDAGFGKQWNWHSPETGFPLASAEKKPILLLFHQDWCGSCQRLKPVLAKATEMEADKDKFVFILTDDETYTKSDQYKADGEYYPKILFLSPDGNVVEEEYNEGTKHEHVKHYYGDGAEVAASMSRMLKKMETREPIASDNNFGKHIRWYSYKEGLIQAKKQSKPMVVIFHKSYCGACKALKPKLRNSKEFGEMSKNFIMVNVGDEDHDNVYDDAQFDQDGAYIPRLFFLDNNGVVETELYNTAQDYKKSKYAYGGAEAIIEQMKRALLMDLGNRKEYKDIGFGKQIKWMDYEEGLQEAKKSHKISMLVFYNDYCMFSKTLKQQFRESPAIAEISKKFVMIAVPEEKGKDLGPKFDVDGTYTPRIIFMDPDQNLVTDANNTETFYPKSMFYYAKTEEIISGMNLALEKINLTLGRGFGEYIEWKTFQTGHEIAKEQNRPIMLIIHRSGCAACKGIKPIVAQSRPIWELSYRFVMINVEDDEEPLDEQYFPDGGYYPRILFMNPSGEVAREIHNQDPTYLKYKYSYGNEDAILVAMKWAVARFYNTKGEFKKENSQTQSTGSPSPNSEGRVTLKESNLEWTSIDKALETSKTDGKPVLFLVHRTTCPSCKAVLRMLARDGDFKEKAKEFVVAEVEDDTDEPTADKYNVDGGYVPRIYFLGPDGKIMEDIWNVGTQYLENKFYFYEMSSVLRAMDKAISRFNDLKTAQTDEKIEIKKGENKKDEDKKDESKKEENKKEETKKVEDKKDEAKGDIKNDETINSAKIVEKKDEL